MRLPEDAERYKRLQEVPENIQHAPARVAHAKHADYGNRERENNFPRKGGTAGGCKKQPEVALGCKGSARGSMEQQGAARAARSSKGLQDTAGAANGTWSSKK